MKPYLFKLGLGPAMPRLELWRPKKKSEGEGSPEASRPSAAASPATEPRVSTWPRLFRLASLLLETSC